MIPLGSCPSFASTKANITQLINFYSSRNNRKTIGGDPLLNITLLDKAADFFALLKKIVTDEKFADIDFSDSSLEQDIPVTFWYLRFKKSNPF